MKKHLTVLLTVCVAASAATIADAREGCGPDAHRGPYGHCRPNGYGYGGPPLIVGNFYGGRGYWDGHRYWARHERWHGGWRYHH